LIAYSTLQLPLAMAALPVVLNVSHFYGEVLKLSLQIMGPIFIFARVVDAIQDPVIGLISDRFTRRGKRGRLTFVALMIPVLAGGFYMLFDPPDAWFGNQTLMALWLMAALLLVHLGYSGVSISYHAHGAELTDDYNERTKVTVGREVFGLLGMTLAVVLPTYPRRSSARAATDAGSSARPRGTDDDMAGPSVHRRIHQAQHCPFFRR
jgi:Na+/melibiose symporter-like transporter